MKPCENTAAICGLFCGTCPSCNKLIIWFDKDTYKYK